MATETVGSLLVSLGFNSAEFDRGIGNASKQARALSTTFNATSKEVALAANRMGISMGAFSGRVAALRASLDPAGAALTSYRNQVNLLRESYRLGAITQAQFVTGMQGALASYRANGTQVTRTNGQMQMGMQQLGFQLNDIVSGFAMGQRPMQIFAQQSGQVVQALTLMSGGTSKLGAFLMGPWGIAMTAGVVALSPFIAKLVSTAFAADQATTALQGMIEAQREASKVATNETQAMIGLNAQRDKALKIETMLDRLRAKPNKRRTDFRLIEARQAELNGLRLQIAEGQAAVTASSKASSPAAASARSGGGGGASGGAATTGPAASEIAARFAGERAALMQSYNSIMAGMAENAQQEAEFQLRNVELQHLRAVEAIKADKEYSAAQKAVLIGQQEEVVEQQRAQVERDMSRRLEQEAEQVIRQRFMAERESLQTQLAMADTEGGRLRLAMALYDLDQREQAAALERIIASETRTEAEKALARLALDQLNANSGAGAEAVARQNETRAQAYARSLSKTPEQISEAIDAIKIDGLERLNDGIVDAIVNFKSLGDVAKSIMKQVLADLLRLQLQQAIMKPLGQALGIPGFAMGTNFAPGGLAIVGERGPELVNLPRGSQVIPNHELAGLAANNNSINVSVNGAMSERQARETGGAIARRLRAELNGPVRA